MFLLFKNQSKGRFWKWLLGILLVLTIVYLVGPHPQKPSLEARNFDLPNDLIALENQIIAKEKAVPGIKNDTQARIVWADSTKKQRTRRVILYIHGFSASQEEGDPVHTNLARKFGANLYLARLADHGTFLGDSTMANTQADQFIDSAEEALAIAKKLGDEVVIVGTSFGGALTLYLASRHPEIKAIALYSPCIKIFDPTAEVLDNPWGLQIAKMVTGSEIRDFEPANPTHGHYWSTHYHLNGVVALQNFLTHAMTPQTFEAVKCPVFVGYYYKNEEEQDKVVSVEAILNMYEQLGSSKKEKVAFPETGNHVLASYVLSKDYQNVENQTEVFLKKYF